LLVFASSTGSPDELQLMKAAQSFLCIPQQTLQLEAAILNTPDSFLAGSHHTLQNRISCADHVPTNSETQTSWFQQPSSQPTATIPWNKVTGATTNESFHLYMFLDLLAT
jgi:hypothetical protein